MTDKTARGFGYVDAQGDVEVDTISLTERAAQVNTIVVATYGNVVPTNDLSDDAIDDMFLNATGGDGHIAPVIIKIAPAN